MSPSKSFWSGIPVVAKALGGIATGVVGIGGLLVALGVIGNSNNNSSPTVTTVPPSDSSGVTNGSGGSGPTTSTKAKGKFTVDPNAVTLSLVKTDSVVTVRNNGTVSLSLNTKVTGQDPDRFTVDASACTGITLASGGSCLIKVTLAGIGGASATLVVSADQAEGSSSVSLKGA
ncbi:MAG: hypothetical protein ACR2LJ_00490 [Acidimicrobiales bacterium]